MRLLIAEDDTTLREGLGDLMTADGFDCHLAADGQAALTCFLAAPFPVVILDVVMPGRDGLGLCRHIRSLAPQTQIMMLSARGESFDKTIGLEHGADDYLAKPFDPAELCARMAAMARRAGRAQASQGFYMDDLWIGHRPSVPPAPVRSTPSIVESWACYSYYTGMSASRWNAMPCWTNAGVGPIFPTVARWISILPRCVKRSNAFRISPKSSKRCAG